MRRHTRIIIARLSEIPTSAKTLVVQTYPITEATRHDRIGECFECSKPAKLYVTPFGFGLCFHHYGQMCDELIGLYMDKERRTDVFLSTFAFTYFGKDLQ